MPTTGRKSVRKLVTLSAELSERVEKFRAAFGATSESDALKMLIEDGLKSRDRREDLFERLKNATESGQNLGDVINFLATDHPLVESTFLTSDELSVNLKTSTDESDQQFRFSRHHKEWDWLERIGDGYDDKWRSVKRRKDQNKSTSDLDDDIPF